MENSEGRKNKVRDILISFVTHGRNDEYMGDFSWRLSTNINKIASNFQKLGLLNKIEILITDWGSPFECLFNKSNLTIEARKVTRFVFVPVNVVRTFEKGGVYSYPHASNTSIRRSRGKYIFSMDSDAYMPFESAKLLVNFIYNNEYKFNFDNSFFWLSRKHIPYQFASTLPSIQEIDKFIETNSDKLITTSKCNLNDFKGGAVAIFANKNIFNSIGGYNEKLIYWGWCDVDIHYRLNMKYMPYDLWDLGIKMYHIEHYPVRNGTVNNRKMNPMNIPTTMLVNLETWGLGSENLEIQFFEDNFDNNNHFEKSVNNSLSSFGKTFVKNIVISGTNFWNPGDDFVRDGVIKILKTIFPDTQLNFLFYNFNQDFFPQSKFTGIHNMAANGDLNLYKDFIDAVVIAGLSAGTEIKDLYNWVIENQLTDRVYLIGAGYENEYVDKFIKEEPELTIFKNAKIITGRTYKRPQLINDLKLPYHHLNCPAILSVDQVKLIPRDKKIEKIAFSIQLPHGIGVPNHSCSPEMYEMSIVLLTKLYGKYEIEVIAHHKSEYFHFLNLFRQFNIPVKVFFSSFYQDLFNIYPRYDLIITTRLHASLFANGFGIPGIIINDTDRHTHCLDGFHHSHWVNTQQKFWEIFKQINEDSLFNITEELKQFKNNLLGKYASVLLKPFGIKHLPKPAILAERKNEFLDKLEIEEKIKNYIRQGASSVEVKKRVYNTISLLEKDYWLERNLTGFQTAIENNNNKSFDTVTFLNWYCREFKPQNYLEIGVRRGRSMAQVLSQSKQTSAIGIDLWIPEYSSIPEKNIHTTNPGPEFVISELEKIGLEKIPKLYKRNSRDFLPEYFNDKNSVKYFDLILVDGDHSYDGARKDLEICIKHLADGGVLVFDDITHISHSELKLLWNEIKQEYSSFMSLEDESGTGTGILIKPPFDKFINIISQNLSKENQNISSTNKKTEYPIHFFTIVLNGTPFIEYHINVLKQLPFRWHWHIIEGVADLKNDTAWSLKNGGEIIELLHNNGLSNDGTTKYLDNLKKLYRDNITIYRKTNGEFWNGKLEMVNEPLKNIKEDCLLWQIDSDELWKAEQIIDVRNMFLSDKDRTSAYFYCRYFVGEKLYIATKNTYGNHSEYEWLRVWNYQPGDKWISHEPPTLCREIAPEVWVDLSKVNSFTQEDTFQRKLVFQHYAYVTEAQLRFKEMYYGYKNALSKWKNLNSQEHYPACLRDYFDWVEDGSVVETILEKDCIAKNENGEWIFNYNGNGICTGNIFKSDSNYILNAETAINNNDLNGARRLLSCALSISSGNIDAKNDLAVVEIMDKNYEEASEILNEVIKSDSSNETALKNKQVLEGILIKSKGLKNEFKEEVRGKENSYVFQINFDLNNGCNLDCIMCGNVPNKKYKDQHVMDKTVFHERFVKVFKYAAVFQFGCFFEPLMVPYFEEAVWAIKSELKPGIKGTIISNGMMLTQSRIEALVDSDIFSKIRFSIDSVSEELFEKIRSGAKLKKLLDNIQRLVTYRNSQNSKSQIEVNFTIMRENVHELPQLILLAKEYGIDSITTHKLTPEDVAYVDNDYYKILTENISYAAQLADENGISFCGQSYYTKDIYMAVINNEIKRECGYYKRNYFLVTIDCYGNITHPCKLTETKLGSLMQYSFEEILTLEPYKKLLASVENPIPDVCTNCGMYI